MMNLAEYRNRNTRLADFLPWAALVGDGVVLNKDGSFQRTARFRGPDLDSAVAAELVAVAGRLNNAFRRLGSGWAIFVEAQRYEASTYPAGLFPDAASALLDAERKADFEEEGSHFVSGYFLTFLWLPPAEDAARSESWLYEGRETSGVNPWELVRGFIDRVDVAPTGEVRVVDYKTGKKPLLRYSQDAQFQMRFYALVYWRLFNVVPTQLKLMYLKVMDSMILAPSREELEYFERDLGDLWAKIEADGREGRFRPRTSKLCDWCSFQDICPAFDGTPPEYPGWPS